MMNRRPAKGVLLSAVLLCAVSFGSDAVLVTQSWSNDKAGFAQLGKRIAGNRGRNLLARKGVRPVGKPSLAHGSVGMLFDGSTGAHLSTGRVGFNGKPAVLTFYLGAPKPIHQVGIFTFNSDARANQDVEVRFADNHTAPGKQPDFPVKPHLTTGASVLGKNSGGFHAFFCDPSGGALVPGRVDWVQFRFWPTYSARAGAPAKAATKASSWTSLVELEILGDPDDVIWMPDMDIAAREVRMARSLRRNYRKAATWQETLLRVCEAMDASESQQAGDTRFQPYVSPRLTGRSTAEKISVSVAGLKRVWLEVDVGGDSHQSDQAVWGDPVLLDAHGKATPLTDLKPAFAEVGWGALVADKDHQGKALRIGGRTFKRGLWAHAPSRLCYRLSGKYEKLQAWVGIAATAAGQGSVRFKVLDLPSAGNAMAKVWRRIQRDFPDAPSQQSMAWEQADGIWQASWQPGERKGLAMRYVAAIRHGALKKQAEALAAACEDHDGLVRVRTLYQLDRRYHDALTRMQAVQWQPVRLAVEDMMATFGDDYPDGPGFLKAIDEIEETVARAGRRDGAKAPTEKDVAGLEELSGRSLSLKRRALMANPLLDFDALIVVKRKANRLGLPANWQSNSNIPKNGYDNEIAVLSMEASAQPLRTLFRPAGGAYVGEVDLHYDAKRLLFSMPSGDGKGPWHIHEVDVTGAGLRQVTQTPDPEVNNYDACYLPDDRIIFTSTAGMVAVPCVRGNAPVATLFRANADGSGMRQLCFDQEHSWHPQVMHDGQVLYARWEYADLPHSNSRMLFTTHPDGTNQRALYGSGSFWPNSMFYPRPVPGHDTKVVATVTGHHAPARMGELIIFDPDKGTREADGVVQRIPGYGKPVVPLIQDGLTGSSWPKFLHPFPLNEHYYLVSSKSSPQGQWGIYLVDVFDNRVLLREAPGYALLEPVPLRPTRRPPVIPDRVDLSRSDAVVSIADIYQGPGLAGIPRGTVKKLRLYTYTYGYRGVGGLYGSIGMDGPWDMRRTLGTVPVESDGSACFRVPANTPITIQPLDDEGKALQIMRSWFTAMPGESLSCVGCHEEPGDAPLVAPGMAMRKAPAKIKPWRGPPRNYAFQQEVQPVLDRFCVGCHDGRPRPDGLSLPDLRGDKMLTGWRTRMAGNTGTGTGGKFSLSYANLHRFVRRPGIESPMPMMTPMEFHADTTELVQMLAKGHHGVKLDAEAWDRINTWIDFNAPYHGRWSTIVGDSACAKEDERARLRLLYANVDENHEAFPDMMPVTAAPIQPIIPAAEKQDYTVPAVSGWPFDPAQARARQLAALRLARDKRGGPGRPVEDAPQVREVALAEGVSMAFVFIPPGEFVMGAGYGGMHAYTDELPPASVRIEKGFWMSRCEVTNGQFRMFKPDHDSREEDRHGYQFGIPGYDVNKSGMPAVRLSWHEAQAFCAWLSDRLEGHRVSLPTEAQWEWACRAGTDTPFSYGDWDADFSGHANLGDAMLADFSGNPYVLDPVKARYGNPDNPHDNWIPQDSRFNDKGFVSVAVGGYAANAWGLCDMHGNVAEWTRSCYRPYPYNAADGRNDATGEAGTKRVVRGGSWYDRPKRCTSSYRWGYRDYQKVFNVGFRVVIADL